MKQLIIILLLLLPISILGQAKSEINSGLPDCNLSLLHESTDTIYFVTQCRCNWIDLDSTQIKTQVIYYCDSLTVRQVVTLKEGKKHSNYLEYYENGTLKIKGNYENGKNIGDYISYYEDGKVKSVGVYTYGRLVGSHFEYWDSGKIATIRTTTAGFSFSGTTIYLDKSGREMTKKEFDKLWWGK